MSESDHHRDCFAVHCSDAAHLAIHERGYEQGRVSERAVWVARIDAAMREQVRLRDEANIRGTRNHDAFLRHYGAVDALMDLLASGSGENE